MLKRADMFVMSKLVLKSSAGGRALDRSRGGATSTCFLGFFHLYVPDFLSPPVGDGTCAGSGAECDDDGPEESAASASSLLAAIAACVKG